MCISFIKIIPTLAQKINDQVNVWREQAGHAAFEMLAFEMEAKRDWHFDSHDRNAPMVPEYLIERQAREPSGVDGILIGYFAYMWHFV